MKHYARKGSQDKENIPSQIGGFRLSLHEKMDEGSESKGGTKNTSNSASSRLVIKNLYQNTLQSRNNSHN